ncbi:DUF4974 domain-containing protein [Puteibacter caeruleilacunae]|nr:DUF4974 domain-containing protein [Puteibacter caeruleilacunae]
MDYNLINKYLRNEATEEEVAIIFHWINESQKNKDEFIQYKKIWAITENQPVADKESVWKDISKAIKKSRKIIPLKQVINYAASVMVLLSLGALLQYLIMGRINNVTYPDETRIEVPRGQMSNLKLPDGSTVILNSGSTLSYSPSFAQGERIVHIEGEAFFDVTHDDENQFIVKTNSVNVNVHGTRFNVEAYDEDDFVKTTLVTGSVSITDKKGKGLALLHPSEMALFDRQRRSLNISKVDTDNYASWKQGVVTFKNEPLADLARKIERWYNVEIVIRNTKLYQEKYMGTILRHKPITQILEVLKMTAMIDYEIVSRADKPDLIYWD